MCFPDIKRSVPHTFTVLVSSLIPVVAEQTGFAVDQARSAFDVVEAQSQLPAVGFWQIELVA